MMCDYIQESWVPDARLKIEEQIQNTLKSIKSCGEPDPLQEGISKDKQTEILTFLCSTLVMKLDLSFSYNEVSSCFVVTIPAVESSWISRRKQWSEFHNQITKQIIQCFSAVVNLIANRCDPVLSDSSLPLFLSRFNVFCDSVKCALTKIVSKLIPNCIEKFEEKSKIIITCASVNNAIDTERTQNVQPLFTDLANKLQTLAITILLEEVFFVLPEKITPKAILELGSTSKINELLTDTNSTKRKKIGKTTIITKINITNNK